MTNTTEKLLPCPHCPFCGSADIVVRMYDPTDSAFCQQVVCRRCNGSSGYFRTEAEAIAAWNSRADEKPKWTKEPPTEPGWYWVASEGCNPNDISCVWVFQREGHLCVSDTMLVTSNWLLSWYCESYTEKLGLGKLLWCKANIPALPEEGEETQ